MCALSVSHNNCLLFAFSPLEFHPDSEVYVRYNIPYHYQAQGNTIVCIAFGNCVSKAVYSVTWKQSFINRENYLDTKFYSL